jgi:TspO/MBR family
MAEYIPMQNSWELALAICSVALAIEGKMSGTKVKARLAELQLPRTTLPAWAWFIIGLVYYAVFFLVLDSLLGGSLTPIWTLAALVFAAGALCINVAWHWAFYRKKDLWLSVALSTLHVLVAIALVIALFRLRNPLAGWYLVCVSFLGVATWWAYDVWRLNLASDARSKAGS